MENAALNHLAQMVYDFCGLNYITNLSSLGIKIKKRLQDLHLGLNWSP